MTTNNFIAIRRSPYFRGEKLIHHDNAVSRHEMSSFFDETHINITHVHGIQT